jgi:hypothetical protein
MINIEEKKTYFDDDGNDEKYPWIGELQVSPGIDTAEYLYVLFLAPDAGFRLSDYDGSFGSYEKDWDEESFVVTDKVFEIKLSNRG